MSTDPAPLSTARAIFEAVNDALFIFDMEGRPVECNPAGQRLFGYTLDEFLQLHIDQLIVPDSLPAFAAFGDTVRAGGDFRARGQLVRKDGTLFHADVRGQAFMHREQLHALAIVRDVSDEVMATQLLEQRVAERTRELATLSAISQSVVSTLELKPLLGLILDRLKEVVGYRLAALCSLEGDIVVLLEQRGADEPIVPPRESVRSHPNTYKMLQEGQPIIIPDLNADTYLAGRVRGNIANYGRQAVYVDSNSWMSVPLIARERPVGLLELTHTETNYYTPARAELVLAFAYYAAIAIENAGLFAAEQRRAEQFRVISEMSYRITSILAVDELVTQTVRLIRETLGYYHVHIGFIEGEIVTFQPNAGLWRDEPVCVCCAPLRMRVGQDGISGRVAASGEPILVPDVTRDPRVISLVPDQAGSELVLPLQVKGRVIGVLDVESDQPNAFTAGDVAVLQSFANQTAVAIENARLLASERRRAEQFRLISEVGRRVTSILAMDELLIQTERLIREIFGHYYVSIGLVEGDELVVRTEEPCDHPRLKIGQEGVMGWVAASGQPLLLPDVSGDPRYIATALSTRTRSEIALPIVSKGRLVGVLNVESDQLNAFDSTDLAVLQSLANQLAAAIENARLYEQSQQLAALEERQKLARELHDSVSQALYGIALGARTARAQLERDVTQVAEPLDYVLSLADAGLAEMRALIFELRPESLQTEGLVAALTKQTDSLRVRHRLAVQTTFGPEPDISLEMKETLYRIAQEALHNIAKHAKAKQVEVKLASRAEQVRLEIRDNGVGFDPNGDFPGHLGLRSMRERAERLGGVFEVASAPGQGTRLTTCVPVTAPSAP